MGCIRREFLEISGKEEKKGTHNNNNLLRFVSSSPVIDPPFFMKAQGFIPKTSARIPNHTRILCDSYEPGPRSGIRLPTLLKRLQGQHK